MTPIVDLAGGAQMPSVGFGVFQIDDHAMPAAIGNALSSGYRLFDTASMYGNESALGKALSAFGLPRGELFLTTKLWNDEQGRVAAREALGRSLERLQTDYLDLYMIHWPVPCQSLYVETWLTLLDLRAEGLARAIGVANFEPEHLDQLIAATGVAPEVNQIELHPEFQQRELRKVHRLRGVVTQAWSPLARGGRVLQSDVIARIAATHGRTPAQVILRWHLQGGSAIIPKSGTAQRIQENIDLFDFTLAEDEMVAIEGLDCGNRTGPDPFTMGC